MTEIDILPMMKREGCTASLDRAYRLFADMEAWCLDRGIPWNMGAGFVRFESVDDAFAFKLRWL
jgi:hypothetical protein